MASASEAVLVVLLSVSQTQISQLPVPTCSA
jgi:hypothetical protein